MISKYQLAVSLSDTVGKYANKDARAAMISCLINQLTERKIISNCGSKCDDVLPSLSYFKQCNQQCVSKITFLDPISQTGEGCQTYFSIIYLFYHDFREQMIAESNWQVKSIAKTIISCRPKR